MSFKVTKTEPRGSAKAIKIASSVTTVDATGSVTYTDVSGTVSNVDLASTVSHVAIAAGVAYRLISPSSILLGYYLLRHEAFDVFSVADVTNFTFDKSLFDEVALTEDVVKFFHGKGNTETAFVSTILDLGLQKRASPDFATFDDSISYLVQFRRTFAETPQVTDYQVFAVEKSLLDIAVSAERLARHMATGKVDQFSAIDSPSLGANKVFANDFAIADAQTIAPTKVLAETSEFADAQRLSFGANIFDTINVTDDFLGASNIDDDQTMHFGKTLIVNGGVSETFIRSVSYTRAFSESPSASEAHLLRTTKPFNEQTALSDTLERTVQFDRNFTDLSSISVDITIDTGRVLQDNGTVIESAVKSTNNINTDSASFTDSGLVFWQGYVEDPTYFAEDYVGNSQTF